MKMAYERPVMKAELYTTNAYCVVCADPNLLGDVDTSKGTLIDLNKNNRYESVISYNAPDGIIGKFDLEHIFSQTTKTEMISYAEGYTGDKQYMWSATGDDGATYYLEYSAEWNDIHQKNGYDGSVFVLYKETTDNNVLDIAWTWNDRFTGTLFEKEGFDTVITGIMFETNKVYWS